jgi:hypothetical protein
MRIRTVKPEFFLSSKIRSLEYETRLLFVGLWCFADDEGRFEEEPDVIKGLIFPSDAVNIRDNLRILERKKLIRRYVVAKKAYYLIPGWKEHQYINKPSRPRTPAPIRRPRRTKKNTPATTGALPEHYLRKGKEQTGTERKSVNLSSHSTAVSGESCADDPADGQTDGEFPQALENLLPSATIRKLLARYPPERLAWAAQRTTAAIEVRTVKRPVSYFKRIVKDDEQWEDYICDQYALGKADALARQKALAEQRRKHQELEEGRRQELEAAAFQAYLRTVPADRRALVTDHALGMWARENNIDIEEHKKRGWWLKKTPRKLCEAHVRDAWLALGKPKQYVPGHLKLPGPDNRGDAEAPQSAAEESK